MDFKIIPSTRKHDIEEVNSQYYNKYNPEYIFTNDNEHAKNKTKFIVLEFFKVIGIFFEIYFNKDFLSD